MDDRQQDFHAEPKSIGREGAEAEAEEAFPIYHLHFSFSIETACGEQAMTNEKFEMINGKCFCFCCLLPTHCTAYCKHHLRRVSYQQLPLAIAGYSSFPSEHKARDSVTLQRSLDQANSPNRCDN